jgi:hypothetical protein
MPIIHAVYVCERVRGEVKDEKGERRAELSGAGEKNNIDISQYPQGCFIIFPNVQNNE